MISRILFILLITYAPTLVAETLLEAGIHHGGDELIIENYNNGGKDSSTAGDLFSLGIGGLKSYTKNIDGQFTIGIKSDIITSGELEVTWVRYPLNAMFFYRADTYRVGLGLTAHFAPKLKGTGAAENITENYKDALGGLFEIDFNINKTMLWGIRYTSIKYESDRRDRSIRGDSLGLLIIARI